MPAISDQDMNAMLADESRVCPSVLLLTDFLVQNISLDGYRYGSWLFEVVDDDS